MIPDLIHGIDALLVHLSDALGFVWLAAIGRGGRARLIILATYVRETLPDLSRSQFVVSASTAEFCLHWNKDIILDACTQATAVARGIVFPPSRRQRRTADPGPMNDGCESQGLPSVGGESDLQ